MRLLVTGGAGFLGSTLTERLCADGHEVIVIDNLSSGDQRVKFIERAGASLEKLDIRSEEATLFIEKVAPKVIFHLAAQPSVTVSVSDPILDAEVNVVGLVRVLEGARLAGSRIVFSSSGGTIYGQPPADLLPIKEGLIGVPLSPYGITKRVGEEYLRFFHQAHDVSFVSLALANIYGPRQDPHGEAGVIAIFARRLIAGQSCTIFGDGQQTRDFVYVDDVVEAMVRAQERGNGETINVGTSLETTIVDLYWSMAELCGSDAPPSFEPERKGELKRNALDVAKAAKVLDWKPRVPLNRGLQMTIDHFRSAAKIQDG